MPENDISGLLLGIEIKGESLIIEYDREIHPFQCGLHRIRGNKIDVWKSIFLEKERDWFRKWQSNNPGTRVLWFLCQIDHFPELSDQNVISDDIVRYFDRIAQFIALTYSSSVIVHLYWLTGYLVNDRSEELLAEIDTGISEYRVFSGDPLFQFKKIYYQKITGKSFLRRLSPERDFRLAQNIVQGITGYTIPPFITDYVDHLSRAGNLSDLNAKATRLIIALEGIATYWAIHKNRSSKFDSTDQGTQDRIEFRDLFNNFIQEMAKKFKDTSSLIENLKGIHIESHNGITLLKIYLTERLGIDLHDSDGVSIENAIKTGYKIRHPDSHGRSHDDIDLSDINQLIKLASDILDYELNLWFDSNNSNAFDNETFNSEYNSVTPDETLKELILHLITFNGRKWDLLTSESMVLFNELVYDDPIQLENFGFSRNLPKKDAWTAEFKQKSINVREHMESFGNQGFLARETPGTIFRHQIPKIIVRDQNQMFVIRVLNTRVHEEILTQSSFTPDNDLVDFPMVTISSKIFYSFYYENTRD